MGPNWEYESGFALTMSNQPYWSYSGYFSASGTYYVFQCLGEQKNCWVVAWFGDISSQADTMQLIY